MKNLKKLFSFVLLALCSTFVLVGNVKAEDVCDAQDGATFKTCAEVQDNKTIKVTGTDVKVTESLDITGHLIEIGDTAKLTIDEYVTVTYNGVTGNGITNITLDGNLVVNGTLKLVGADTNIGIQSTDVAKGHIVIGAKGELNISKFKQGGIAKLSDIEVNGSLVFTENGYGSNTAAITVKSTGSVVASDNKVGFTAKLGTEDGASVTAYNNSMIGMVLVSDSNLAGGKISAYSNGGDDSKRDADIAINSTTGHEVKIGANAEVDADSIRTYVKEDYTVKEGHVEVNGTVNGNFDSEKMTLTTTNSDGKVKLNGDIYITEDEYTIPANVELVDGRYIISKNTKIINNSSKSVYIYTEDSETGKEVPAGQTVDLETITITVIVSEGEEEYAANAIVFKGQTLAETMGAEYEEVMKAAEEGYKISFVDEEGKAITLDTVLTDGMTIKMVIEKIENPNTGDNIVLYSVVGLVSLVSAILGAIYLKTREN